jgi:hypothetical protein
VILSLRELELVEVEQAGHMPAGNQPPVDVLGYLFLVIVDLIHQWSAVDELVQVLHGSGRCQLAHEGSDANTQRWPNPSRETLNPTARVIHQRGSPGKERRAGREVAGRPSAGSGRSNPGRWGRAQDSPCEERRRQSRGLVNGNERSGSVIFL